MKLAQTESDRKRAHVIDQLKKHGLTDNEHSTYRELVNKLATARAMEIEVKSPHADWW
ncbi:hypothetical protein ACDX78_13585 [Virgibacillus oceani]